MVVGRYQYQRIRKRKPKERQRKLKRQRRVMKKLPRRMGNPAHPSALAG
jgi:hypothetical protein